MGIYELPKHPSVFFDKPKYGPYGGSKKQPDNDHILPTFAAESGWSESRDQLHNEMNLISDRSPSGPPLGQADLRRSFHTLVTPRQLHSLTNGTLQWSLIIVPSSI